MIYIKYIAKFNVIFPVNFNQQFLFNLFFLILVGALQMIMGLQLNKMNLRFFSCGPENVITSEKCGQCVLLWRQFSRDHAVTSPPINSSSK